MFDCDNATYAHREEVELDYPYKYKSLHTVVFDFSHFDERNTDRAVFKVRGNMKHRVRIEMEFRGLCDRLGYGKSSPALMELESARREKRSSERSPEFQVHMGDTHEPIVIVQVRGGVSDSEIPRPRIDTERQEFSCEWKGLLSSFFQQKVAASKAASSVCRHLSSTSLVLLANTSANRQDPHVTLLTDIEIQHVKAHRVVELDDIPMWADLEEVQIENNKEACLQDQVRTWKDLVCEVDRRDRFSAERLYQVRAADRTLYLDNDGVAEVTINRLEWSPPPWSPETHEPYHTFNIHREAEQIQQGRRLANRERFQDLNERQRC